MKLKLERPLAIFDIEATGLNISKEKIVEIAILKIHPNGVEERFRSLINPEITISEEVIKIHGITNEMVENSPTFKDIAPTLISFLENTDLAGYNSNKFDIPLLAEEFLRAEINFDISEKKFVDVQNIFHKMEQRTLIAAYNFYCGKELENAHNAMNDTEATWEVLKSQIEKYDQLEGTIEFLSEFSSNGNNADLAGRLIYTDNKEIAYNFGKHKGKTVQEVSKIEPGYYSWFISPQTDFPLYTKQKLKEEMEKIKQNSSPKETFDDKINALKSKFSK